MPTYCAVPKCKAFTVATGKASVFSFPTDPAIFERWEKAIPGRKNLKNVSRSYLGVCELHFEERYIQRNYVHVINGEKVFIPRAYPRLTPEAVPTKFPPPEEWDKIIEMVTANKHKRSNKRRINISGEPPVKCRTSIFMVKGCSKDQKQCAPDMNIIPQEIKLEIIPKIEQGESSSQLASTSSLQTLPDFNDTIRTAVLNIKKEPIDYTEYNQAESSTQLGFSSSSFQTLPAAGPAFLNIKKEPIDYTEYNQEEFSSEPLPSGESSIFKGSEMLPIKIKTEPLDYPDDCNPECILPDFL